MIRMMDRQLRPLRRLKKRLCLLKEFDVRAFIKSIISNSISHGEELVTRNAKEP